MSTRPPISRYEEVAGALRSGDFELFTCDVFDTLVWRPVARPTDLFVTLGSLLVARGLLPDGFDPVEFSGTRQWAEADARRLLRNATGSVECNLDEIWQAMPAKLTHRHSIDDFIEAELDCEATNMRAHSGATELIGLAHELGVRAVLVSDTYLSAERLQRLLNAAGVGLQGIERIATSSDARLGKADGLLVKVAASARVDPRRMLHFGDNPVSDLSAAVDAGATAYLAEVDPSRRAVRRPSRSVVDLADRTGTDGALGAAVRETLVSAGATAASAAYQFGAAIAGPALAGFASWASSLAEQHEVATVHCLLREGAVIADLMTTARPNGPVPRLVHASRWAMVRAAVFEGSVEEIFTVIERRTRFRPEHLAAAFDLPAHEVARVLPDETYQHDQRWDAIVSVADDPVLREQIVAASAAQRRNVLEYFERTLDLAGDRLVLCDIGWGGKIQATIDAILRSDGFDGEVVGLYLMLSETGVKRRRDGAIMHSYLPQTVGSGLVGPAADVVQHHAAILERIATPEIGTLIGFDDGGEPVCRPDDHDLHAPSLLLARQGVYDVTDRLVGMAELDAGPWRDVAFRAALLDALADAIAEPSPLLATELGEWRHDDLAGDDLETLIAGDVAGLVRYLNSVDASAIGWDEVFWLPGLTAGGNPVLTAQLAAARFGIDVADLTSTSDTGTARIASFPVGSDLASHQTEGIPRRSPDGWHLLRLHTSVPSARSLRLDAGSEACLVQLGHFHLRLTTEAGSLEFAIDGFTDRRLQWIDGRPLGATIAAFSPGGHLLIELGELGDIVGVDVDWAFRTWRLDGVDVELARPTLIEQASAAVRRSAQAARRRVLPH